MSRHEQAAFAQPATGVKHGAALTLGDTTLSGELVMTKAPTKPYARSACQGMYQSRYGRFGFTSTTEVQPGLILSASIQAIMNLVLDSNHAVAPPTRVQSLQQPAISDPVKATHM